VEKNNKMLPIPETMQGISTRAESKEERSKKKTKKTNHFLIPMPTHFGFGIGIGSTKILNPKVR